MLVIIAIFTACNEIGTTTEVVLTVAMKFSVFWTVTPFLLFFEYVYVSVTPFYLPKK
jgi:hypothetical protein